jgi:Antibiotic biosynthesis monooxygenase
LAPERKETQVSYLRISVFELAGGNYQEVADRAMVELVEKQLKTAPGFVSYTVGRDADGNVVIVSQWQTAEQATTVVTTAADWGRNAFVGDQMRPIRSYLVEVTHSTAGE